jgi:hypothetical protein
MLYNAALRVELSARLGVVWKQVDRNGQADMEGVPRSLIELSRSAAMTWNDAEHSASPRPRPDSGGR